MSDLTDDARRRIDSAPLRLEHARQENQLLKTRIATLETRVEVEVELRKASYERITELEAGLLRALHVINVFGKCSHSMQTWLHIPASCEFSHGPDDDLTIDEWLTDD